MQREIDYFSKDNIPVELGMQCGNPTIKNAVDRLRKEECDKIITEVRRHAWKYEDVVVWAKQDLPLVQCLPQTVLFAIKKLLIKRNCAPKVFG